MLIQVYNWEIRHHSLVCRCGLADIFYTKVTYRASIGKVFVSIV